ncbi:hypothetical protein ACYR0R_005784, partial [Escherichia coli]
RLGAVMEMAVWQAWKNGCNDVCNPWEDVYNPWERGWNDGWTECLDQRIAGLLKVVCIDFSDAD